MKEIIMNTERIGIINKPRVHNSILSKRPTFQMDSHWIDSGDLNRMTPAACKLWIALNHSSWRKRECAVDHSFSSLMENTGLNKQEITEGIRELTYLKLVKTNEQPTKRYTTFDVRGYPPGDRTPA
jgi:hypothetical protein